MFDSLQKYIIEYSSQTITDEEFALIQQTFKPKKIRKREYFLQKGEVCEYMGFITKGSMRQYSVDEKGNEHIVNLCIENWWAGDYESYLMITPSKYNVDAVEDSEMLIISNEHLRYLKINVPAISKMLEIMDQRYLIATQRRVLASISYSAEKMYMELLNSYPEICQRFSQNMIASYLGLTPETLSRVRKQLSSNKVKHLTRGN